MTYRRLQQAVSIARKVLAMVACVALLVMMILTFVDVIGRYGLHNSIFGVSEMVELLMVAVVFGGFALVTASDTHISVTLLDHFLIARAPKLMRRIRFLFSLCIYTLFLWIFWGLTMDAAESARQTIVLSLPLWLFSGTAAVLSSLGLVLFVLTNLLRELK
jgi:TRAP-type C4-dicarboxylate transport system permease small subunit